MQTRLFVSLAGGLLGLAFAPEITAWLGLDVPLALAFAACGIVGFAIAYVCSLLVDVFGGASALDRADSRN